MLHYAFHRRAQSARGTWIVQRGRSVERESRATGVAQKEKKGKSEFGKKTIKLGFEDGVAFISFVFRQTADDQSVL